MKVNLGKLKVSLLVVCVGFSLFVSGFLIPRVGGPGGGREIKVYVVDASDSVDWCVGDRNAVKQGIQEAIYDANTKTKVKLAGETICNPILLNNSDDLEYYLNNPPENAAFINAHGEVVPLSNKYFAPYVRIDSPLDGAVLTGTVTVEATVKTVGGVLLSGSPCVNWTEWLNIRHGPCAMTLVDAVNGKYRAYISLENSGESEITVYAKTVHGLRTCVVVTIQFAAPPPQLPAAGGTSRPPIVRCPYVCPWSGADYVVDNNLLFDQGDFSLDYYRLEKSLVKGADGNYSLRLQESGDKRSFFDYVQLLAVDHASDVSVGVDADGDGTIVTYGRACAPCAARLWSSANVKWWVSLQDGNSYAFYDGDWLDLCFDSLNVSSGAKLVLRMRSNNEESFVSVQRYNASCVRETVATAKPRAYWSTLVLNLTGLLPDYFGQNDIRLVFSGNCNVDFVGLDTSAEANVTVHEAELISVEDSSGIDATFSDLQCADGVCAELRKPYTIDLRFRLPVLNVTGLKRDFIFVAVGYYEEKGGVTFAGAGGGCAWDIVVNWKGWFDMIEERCRTKGWIWANVAGYSFRYFGNNAYCDLMGAGYVLEDDDKQPRGNGLIQFLSRYVVCLPYDGHWARRGYDFLKQGFLLSYPSLPNVTTYLAASRPISAYAGLPWDCLGYVDPSDGSHVSVAIAMNKTEIWKTCLSGIFVHNGFSEDINGDSQTDSSDDWLKGYVAAVMAIEEAKSLISHPTVQTESWGNIHATAFTASMRPGDWGEDWDDKGHYRYIRLEFSVGARYDYYYPWPYDYWYFLTQADFDITGGDTTRFKIDVAQSGIDTGDRNASLMNDLYWWTVGTLAGALPGVAGLVLGPAIGLIPILINYFEPSTIEDFGHHIWAKEINVDPNSDDRGTAAMFVEIRFYGIDGQGDTDYAFNVNMASWIGYMYTQTGYILWRFSDIPYTTLLAFTVRW